MGKKYKYQGHCIDDEATPGKLVSQELKKIFKMLPHKDVIQLFYRFKISQHGYEFTGPYPSVNRDFAKISF